MLNVSRAFRDVLKTGNKKYFVSGTITLLDTTVIQISNDNIVLGGAQFDDALCSDTTFGALGAVPISQVDITLDNRSGDYTNVDFHQAEVAVSVGLDTGTAVEYVQKGFYIVDDVAYNGASVAIKALDFASKLDKPYTDTPWYVPTTLVYPATLGQIASNVCSRCNLILDNPTFQNYDFVISTKPEIPADTTFREVLSWVATIAGCFVKAIGGTIKFTWFDTATLADYENIDFTDSTYTPESAGMFYFSSIFKQAVTLDPITITGVKITIDDTTYINGTDDYCITLDNKNLFITATNAQTVVDYLGSHLVGMTFHKANVQHISDPTIEAGDIAVVHDSKKNKNYPIVITRTNFGVFKKQTTVCGAETPNTKLSTRFSAISKAEAKAAQLVEEEKTQRELVEEEFARQLAQAGGMYTTDVESPAGSGSYIRYLHNKPNLAESSTQVRIDNSGAYISNDYGQTWPYGLDYGGNTILNKVYAIGIDADYITTGLIQSRVSGFSLNMDTGVANLSNVNITGGSINIETTNESTYVTRAVTVQKEQIDSDTMWEYVFETKQTSESFELKQTESTYSISNPSSRTDETTQMVSIGAAGTTFSSNGKREIMFGLAGLVFSPAGVNSLQILPRSNITLSAGLVSGVTSPGSAMFKNGIAFTNPATVNDQGWIRVTGTGESDTELEIATANDADGSEKIVLRQYDSVSIVKREAYLFDNNGNSWFPGRMLASGGFLASVELVGQSGTAGYVLIASIDIYTSYTNKPLVFLIGQRGKSPTLVEVRFKNSSSTDPDLDVFAKLGSGSVYMSKHGTGSWALWCQKTEAWDGINLYYYTNPYAPSQLKVTPLQTIYQTLPSGYVSPSVWNATISNATTASSATTATTATMLDTTNANGYTTDEWGNFNHSSTNTTNYWHINKNAGDAVFSVYFESGIVDIASTGDYRKNGTSIVPTSTTTNTSGFIKFPNIKMMIAWRWVAWTGAISNAWGTGYESTAVISLGNWAESFNEEPKVVYGVRADSGKSGVTIEHYGKPSTTSAGSVYLWRPSSMTSQKYWICAIGIGRYT